MTRGGVTGPIRFPHARRENASHGCCTKVRSGAETGPWRSCALSKCEVSRAKYGVFRDGRSSQDDAQGRGSQAGSRPKPIAAFASQTRQIQIARQGEAAACAAQRRRRRPRGRCNGGARSSSRQRIGPQGDRRGHHAAAQGHDRCCRRRRNDRSGAGGDVGHSRPAHRGRSRRRSAAGDRSGVDRTRDPRHRARTAEDRGDRRRPSSQAAATYRGGTAGPHAGEPCPDARRGDAAAHRTAESEACG